MNAKTSFFTVVLLAAVAVSAGAEQGVSFLAEGTQITVQIDGKEFAVYNTSTDLPKPFFSPVRGSDGTILSRPIENPEDHKHHKGIWVSVDEVNDVKFWAEAGKIQNVATVAKEGRGDAPATLQTVNHWLGDDGKPIVVEDTTISIFSNRLMAFDINFIATEKEVTFGDTKEGLFGFRMVNSMREKETGKVVNADGKQGTAECWGIPSAWVDYYGEVEGKVFGVTLMDHPGNFRPSRYHVRNYGLFSISPFGEKAYTGGKNEAALVVLKPGESLVLRYAIYIHDGDTAAGHVAEAYKQFLDATN